MNNKLFSEENKVPEHCLVAGSTKYNNIKQYKLCCPLIQFIQSWKQKEFVYLVCLGRKKSTKEDLSLLKNISSTKLQSAPITLAYMVSTAVYSNLSWSLKILLKYNM